MCTLCLYHQPLFVALQKDPEDKDGLVISRSAGSGSEPSLPNRSTEMRPMESLFTVSSKQSGKRRLSSAPPGLLQAQMQLSHRACRLVAPFLLQLHILAPVCNAVRLCHVDRLTCPQEASSVHALHLSRAALHRSAATCCDTCQSQSCWLPLSASSALPADAHSARASTPLSGRGLLSGWDIDPEDVEILKTGDGEPWLLGEGSFGKVGGAMASQGLCGGSSQATC